MKYICRPPGKKSRDIIARDAKVTSPSYAREYSFVYERAKGVHLWDVDGRKYLDFAAGIAVMGVGHTNPEVVRAVRKQAALGLHAAFPDFYAELPVHFIEKLLTFVPKSLNTVFLSNSGTESVECAVKLAKWHTKRPWMIAFKNCFHGRTYGSLSMTDSKPVQRQGFEPFLPVEHADFPDKYRNPFSSEKELVDCSVRQVRAVFEKHPGQVAAVMVEPIQGEGGYIIPPNSFLKELHKVCQEHQMLLCADEVQTGCYRTGTFLASQGYGVVPDIVSLSKAIGGGIPLGATISHRAIMNWPPAAHSNTFGGNLVACAAGMATLDFMKRKKLGQNAAAVGGFLLQRLRKLLADEPAVGDVRGRGLMIGVEFVKDKDSKEHDPFFRDQILCKAAEKGLILLPAGKSTIRICPPLILTKQQAATGAEILAEAVEEIQKSRDQ